jgi:hypothetical protein
MLCKKQCCDITVRLAIINFSNLYTLFFYTLYMTIPSSLLFYFFISSLLYFVLLGLSTFSLFSLLSVHSPFSYFKLSVDSCYYSCKTHIHTTVPSISLNFSCNISTFRYFLSWCRILSALLHFLILSRNFISTVCNLLTSLLFVIC